MLFRSRGNTGLYFASLDGQVRKLTGNVGSTTSAYGGGSAFTVARDGTYAVTHTCPDCPGDIAVGRADGSPQGAGALTLNRSDFQFAWYIRTVHAKITDKWAGRALPGQQPVAVFDINRDGRISGLAIKKSSGNSYYDQAALRAITEAAPFPPLPSEYDGPALGVELGFHFPERG